LLVQQFFSDSAHASFVHTHFIPLYVKIESPEGEAFRERYEIYAFPSVPLIQSDGSILDILSSYRDPESYRQRLEHALRGEDTYAAVKARYDADPRDLRITARLVQKYMEMWQSHKAGPLAIQIVERAEEAKTIQIPFGRERDPVNLYEAARLLQAGMVWEEESSTVGYEAFIAEFPDGDLIAYAYNDLARRYIELGMANEKSDQFFLDLKDRFPEDEGMEGHFIRYCISSGRFLETGETMARRRMEEQPGSRDRRQNLTDILLKGERISEALDLYGESYIANFQKNATALNSYAWFWALREKNLESALETAKRALSLKNDPNIWDTLSMVYLKMKEYQKAIEAEEKAYELAPSEGFKRRIEEIREEMTKIPR
jgi:tetratricopeptide (TPR) repeat protein